MPRSTTTRRSAAAHAEPETSGRLGGVLRGSMNSVMGTVGLNVPLRAIERLTGAVERAAAMLERFDDDEGVARLLDLIKRADRISRSVERGTKHLDRIDAAFLDRVNEALEVLVQMRQDTKVMRQRMESLETEVRALQTVLTERLDRVPLLRPSRRERRSKTVEDAPAAIGHA